MKRTSNGRGLTVLDKLQLKLFHTHLYNYHTLIRERTSIFESDGSVELTKTDGTKCIRDGRKWIADHIRFFEKEDQATYYLMCADLKKVLDEYDERFKTHGKKEAV